MQPDTDASPACSCNDVCECKNQNISSMCLVCGKDNPSPSTLRLWSTPSKMKLCAISHRKRYIKATPTACTEESQQRYLTR